MKRDRLARSWRSALARGVAALWLLPRRALVALVLTYRFVLKPWLGNACRFEPTCSAYALEALETHGPFKGLYLAARRIARCHPLTWLGGSSGFDPVPKR